MIRVTSSRPFNRKYLASWSDRFSGYVYIRRHDETRQQDDRYFVVNNRAMGETKCLFK